MINIDNLWVREIKEIYIYEWRPSEWAIRVNSRQLKLKFKTEQKAREWVKEAILAPMTKLAYHVGNRNLTESRY